jgi:hypothetical protein
MSENEIRSDRWLVRKAAGLLKPGERFIFAEEFGGEGEVLTVRAISADMFGTTEIEVEELDFTLDFGTKQWVTMETEEEGDG